MSRVLCACGCGAIFDTSVPTYWNGIPITSSRGTAIVAGERIPVVMVNLDGANYGGGIDYLDNRDDRGWRKIAYGYGSPRYGHRNVTIEPGSFIAEQATR